MPVAAVLGGIVSAEVALRLVLTAMDVAATTANLLITWEAAVVGCFGIKEQPFNLKSTLREVCMSCTAVYMDATQLHLVPGEASSIWGLGCFDYQTSLRGCHNSTT